MTNETEIQQYYDSESYDVRRSIAWGQSTVLDLRREICRLEDELARSQGKIRELGIDLLRSRDFKATYAILSARLQELRDPRLRTLTALRHPDAENLLRKLSYNSKLSLSEFNSNFSELEIAVQLTDLGKLQLKDGYFLLTKKGKELMKRIGYFPS